MIVRLFETTEKSVAQRIQVLSSMVGIIDEILASNPPSNAFVNHFHDVREFKKKNSQYSLRDK